MHGLSRKANTVVELQRENGFIDIIEVETTRHILLSPSAPDQLLLGPARDTIIYSCQSPARFKWNGQACIGYLEHGRFAIQVTLAYK